MNPNKSQYRLTHQQAVQQLATAMNSGALPPHVAQAQLRQLQLQQQNMQQAQQRTMQPQVLQQAQQTPGTGATPFAATNLAPLLQQAKQSAQQQVQQQLHAVQQQLPQTAPTASAVGGGPMGAVAASATAPAEATTLTAASAPDSLPPLPPMLDSLETDDGIYVDDQEFDLAQSRVKRWLELEAEIATLSAALRDRRKQREDLNKHIISFMQGNAVPHFEMSRGNLSLQVSKHKQPLNQKWITSRIQAVEGISEEKQQELLRLIFEERAVTEKPRLKHLKNRKKK